MLHPPWRTVLRNRSGALEYQFALYISRHLDTARQQRTYLGGIRRIIRIQREIAAKILAGFDDRTPGRIDPGGIESVEEPDF